MKSPRGGELTARATHAFGHDADFLDTGALGQIDHLDDFTVAQRGGAHDEHRLLLALLEDASQLLAELTKGNVLIVDGVVNGVANVVMGFSGIFRYMQSGYIYNYAFSMALGVVVMLGYFIFK